MGICASCLGGRRPSDTENGDSTHHLLADPYQPQYGSINGPNSHNAPQPDPEEIRRQRDALERICAQTSDKLIHVSHATYTDHGPSSEYHRLFRERFPPTNTTSNPSADPEVAETEEDEATWLASIIGNSSSSNSNNNDVEGSWERVEPIKSGALTIQFGDALGLDRKR